MEADVGLIPLEHSVAVGGYQQINRPRLKDLRTVAIVFGHPHDWFGRQWRRADGTLLVSPGPRGGVLAMGINGEAVFVQMTILALIRRSQRLKIDMASGQEFCHGDNHENEESHYAPATTGAESPRRPGRNE